MSSLLHRYVPAHFHSPLRLAARLVRTRDPAAIFAIAAAAGGAAAAPLDLAMQPAERRAYASASSAPRPLLFVCGAPRSGTTLVHQTLAAALPVDRFTNVVNLFPRSPLAATRLLQRWLRPPTNDFHSFYGRTAGLSGLSDALPIWERYLGVNSSDAPPHMTASVQKALRQFFSAWTRRFDRPLVSKCNRLVAAAADAAAALPEATIVCLRRDALWHAQSLYLARLQIHGDLHQPYGLAPPGRAAEDPIESVCRQVQFHRRLQQTQLDAIGPERFWVLSYEQFCDDPRPLIERAAEILFGDRPCPIDARGLVRRRASQSPRLPAEDFARMRRRLVEMQLLSCGGEAGSATEGAASSRVAAPGAASSA